MRTLAISISIFLLPLLMFMSCNSSDDDFSAEDLAYFEQNEAYLEEKKKEVDADGNPIYLQLDIAGEVVLYRVIDTQPTEKPAKPEVESIVTLAIKGQLIDQTEFYQDDSEVFELKRLVPGLAYVLLETHTGETVEVIIPASLGYGFRNSPGGIPNGSTLIFTYTLLEIK